MKKNISLIILIVAIFMGGCKASETEYDTPEEMVTLRMTISDNLSYAAIFIAEEEGYFAKYGIQIEYVTSDKVADSIAMLSSGKIDVYAGTLNTGLINAIQIDDSIKVVADRGHTEPGTCTYQAIVVRKDLIDSGQVTTPEDLKGLTFSTTTAGPAAYLLSSYISQGGLSFEDLDIIDLPTVSEMDGFETGSLDGSIAPEPSLTRLLRTGDVAVLATAEDVIGIFQSGIIAFNDQLLEKTPDVGVRFMAAYLEGVRQYNQGKTERNVEIIAAATGEAPEDVKEFCWVPISADGLINFQSIDAFQEWSIEQDQLSEAVSEEQFWDPYFVEQAILLLGESSEVEIQESKTYDPVALKMNYALVISYAPIILAEAEGYFEEYGITIEKVTFNSSVEAVPLVVSGEIDVFAGASTAGILNVLGQEDNIKVVADRGHIEPGGCTFQAIVVRKDLYDSGEITSGEDLAGHSVSTPPTGPGMYFLSTYLEQMGLTVDDVEVVDIPTASYVDAFANKAVDAIVPTELHLSRLMAAGNAVILASSEDVVGYYQTSLLAFGKNLLKDDPDLGVRFLAAYLKGVEKYNEGKTEDNLEILSEATGIDIETLKNSCWLSISPDGLIDFDGMEKFQQWSLDQGFMERVITEQEFMDTSFLARAKALLEEENNQ